MALNLGPLNWRGDIKWEEIPVQTNTPLPSSTLQSYFHPHFPFFSFLLPPGAAAQPSRCLISISLVDSGGLCSFVLFAPSAEKNPSFPSPLCPVAPPAILTPKKGRAELVPPHMYVQMNKTQEGGGVSFSVKVLPRKCLGEPDRSMGQEQEAETREENGS